MFDLIFVLSIASGVCLIFGVVYPLLAILFYPIYRACGGRMKLREYIRSL